MLIQKQYSNFKINLSREGNANTTLFLIMEEAAEIILGFSQEPVKAL